MNSKQHKTHNKEHDHRRNPKHGDRHTHHFDASQAEYLRSDERLTKIRHQDIVEMLNVEDGMNVLDLGTGSGAFLPELVEKVGDAGNVYGVDVSTDWLSHAREFVIEQDLNTVSLLRNSDKSLPLRDRLVDRALAVCLLHELTHPEPFLEEVYRVIKPGGTVLILEWANKSTEEGPPVEHRLSFQEARNWLETAGFDSVRRNDWTDSNYVITAKRSE
ncbi:MAG: class I SAM-dependent methyltransferase [bacterium]